MMDFIRHIQARDDARPTVMEVILAYPGFHIMTVFHPPAHALWKMNLRALARFWSYAGRAFTGIEIHPAAVIGKNLFIDHGTGVVIGQTAVVGDGCLLYHGVTLGGRGGHPPGARRHPALGSNVTVGAGAQLLGPITVGDGAKIGANAVVTADVPAGVTAVGNPARLVGKIEADADIPDPVAAMVEGLSKELTALRSFVEANRKKKPEEYSGPVGI